jgi:hypothetical protein
MSGDSYQIIGAINNAGMTNIVVKLYPITYYINSNPEAQNEERLTKSNSEDWNHSNVDKTPLIHLSHVHKPVNSDPETSLLIKEATSRVAIIGEGTANGYKVENVVVVVADNSLLSNAFNFAVKMRSVGGILHTRNVGLQPSNWVEEDLVQSVVVACRSDSGSIGGAHALSLEQITVYQVQTELEGSAWIKSPASDAVVSRSDREPGIRVTRGEGEGGAQGSS